MVSTTDRVGRRDARARIAPPPRGPEIGNGGPRVSVADRRLADREFMATLAKGLAVLGAFGEQHPTLSLSEAAVAASLSRAAARRVLRTLAELGYVTQSGRRFSLAPRILELGFAFLSTQSWIDRAEPLMKELSHSLHESCSAAILQGNEIVYVARMPAPHRIMSTTIAVGSRLPAFYTSLGRIQLGRGVGPSWGLAASAAYSWITLMVPSALDAVGLTAAVATALTREGIACNVIAGFHHDHLFVPVDETARAMSALARLSRIQD